METEQKGKGLYPWRYRKISVDCSKNSWTSHRTRANRAGTTRSQQSTRMLPQATTTRSQQTTRMLPRATTKWSQQPTRMLPRMRRR